MIHPYFHSRLKPIDNKKVSKFLHPNISKQITRGVLSKVDMED